MGFDKLIQPVPTSDGKGQPLQISWNRNALVPTVIDAGGQEAIGERKWGINPSDNVTVINHDPLRGWGMDRNEVVSLKLQEEIIGWGGSGNPIEDDSGETVKGLVVEFYKAGRGEEDNLFRVLTGAGAEVYVLEVDNAWVRAQDYTNKGVRGETPQKMPLLHDDGQEYQVAVRSRDGAEKIYDIKLTPSEHSGSQPGAKAWKKGDVMMPNSQLEVRKRN